MSGTRRGGNHAVPARLPQKLAKDYSVSQLKAKLSFAGVENAGIDDKAKLAYLASRHGLL